MASIPSKAHGRWQGFFKHSPFGLLVGVLLIGLAGCLVWSAHEYTNPRYAVVQMTGGEVYFGRFRRWPVPALRDPWVLQRGMDQNGQVQTSVASLERAFWQPSGALYLNTKNILTWSYLRPDSALVKYMQDPNQPSLSNDVPNQVPENVPAEDATP